MHKFNLAITKNGEHIITIYPSRGFGAAQIEAWVKAAAEQSGQDLDWHYIGGRGIVWWQGDNKYKAKHYLEVLKPDSEIELKWVADSTSVLPLNYEGGKG